MKDNNDEKESNMVQQNDNKENEIYDDKVLKEKEENKDIDKDNEDIKKQPGRFLTSTLAIMLILLLFTIASVASYAPLKSYFFMQEDDVKNYIESRDFIYTLTGLTDYLYQSKIKNVDWYSSRHEDLRSIKYYISNKDKTISISNISEVTDKKLEKEIEKSQFYLKAKLHKEGNVEVETSLEDKFDERAFINGLDLRRWQEISLIEEENTGEIIGLDNEEGELLEDLEITYVIPKDLEKYNDYFTYDIKSHHVFSRYIILILVIGAISIFLLSIIAFSIPYSHQKKSVMCRLYNKIFLELKGLLWLGFLFIGIGGVSLINPYYYNNSFNIVNIIYEANDYFYIIGIPITFIFCLLVYLTIVYIKYVYYTGFKKGFIENSFMGKVGFNIIRRLRKALREVMTIDITKDPHKRIFAILATNLLILWMIALSGGFAFILAIIWSVFLFRYLVGLMFQMKALYDASSQLAEGDFNINLNEDIGMLSPISKNLNNIKEGFKLAVDKEIKSQRMKAELISNVSHDLKTPLTSIITYVDLLKNQDITKETQKEYIDILDRKSKRLKILIEDLFEASKASSGNIELDLEKVDIIALFRQTLGELEEKINESTLQMRINAPENKIICELDGKRTYRIFENIMGNILKYAMSNSRVYIDIVEGEREVSFIFKNISAYEMNFDATEITERFTRGDESRNTEGSGLGLSIAKSFVELQRGRMEIVIDGDLFKLILTFPKV